MFQKPPDPYFGNQYYLCNEGKPVNGRSCTAGADINVLPAWENFDKGAASIVIAVLDQGVTANHPDLPNTRQIRLPGSNFGDGDPNDPSPMGNDNHGNSCAGIIAASHNNEGIAGIAPNCKIMPIRTCNSDGKIISSVVDLAAAIRFAVDNGADIISNSWGYTSSNGTPLSPNLYPEIVDAIEYATTKGRDKKGCVVVFSAGNTANHAGSSHGNVSFPANVTKSGTYIKIPSVISVGASDRNDLQANYSPTSSYNTSTYTGYNIIDVVAPSHRAYSSQIPSETFDVWTIDIPDDPGYNKVWATDGGNLPTIGSYLPNSGTNYKSYTGHFGGTSAACPQVAGIAALILSVNPNLTSGDVVRIIRFTARKAGSYDYNNSMNGNFRWSKELGWGVVNADNAVDQAYREGDFKKVDLMVRDCPLDIGKEPNTESQYFYISEDIWVRNNNFPFSLEHQNPLGLHYNTVYVKVTNRGKTPSSGTERLFLYWCKAGANLGWSRAWDGTKFFDAPFNHIPVGQPIDSIPIPQIYPGNDIILPIQWYVGDPSIYCGIDGIDDPWHFCLLARIVAPETDPMKIPEVMNKHVEVNVKNNNNIAQKNVTILNIGDGYSSIGSSIFVGNWSDAIKSYCLRFKLGANATTLHQEAEVMVKLGDKVFEAWERGGKICQDVEVKDDRILLIKGNNAKLCNLIFYPHEIGRMSLTFNFLTRKKDMDNLEYDIHVVQTDYQTEEVIGGEQYHVVTPPRVPFYAQADDIYAFVNDPITFHAADIGEPAVYRWYDMSGNLVCEEQNFSTVAIHEKQYKLEVIALSDGYKDYATVKVKIVPGKIEEIFPNPTDNDITVVCVFNNVDAIPEAYIQVSDYMGMIYNEFQLKDSPATVSFSTQNYPIGTYVVRLFCNGQVADVKTFVRH